MFTEAQKNTAQKASRLLSELKIKASDLIQEPFIFSI